jgi:dipeptidase
MIKECKEDEEEECIFIESLGKEFNEIMHWALGKGGGPFDKETAIRGWKKRHPTADIPRILMSKHSLNPEFSTIFLLLDIYPLYLKSKKKVCE